MAKAYRLKSGVQLLQLRHKNEKKKAIFLNYFKKSHKNVLTKIGTELRLNRT